MIYFSLARTAGPGLDQMQIRQIKCRQLLDQVRIERQWIILATTVSHPEWR